MKITQATAGVITALLTELGECFPNEVPINNNPSLEDFRKLQGQQEVIQFIRNLIDPEETEETRRK